MDVLSIFNIVTAVVTLASAVANVTKTDADNKIVSKASKVIHFLALNFFKK